MNDYYTFPKPVRSLLFISFLLIGTIVYSQTEPSPDSNGIVYVKPSPSGNGSGDSWANATSDLQDAIDALGTRQVWVMVGRYHTNGTSFVMKNNVAIYGGFDPDNGIDDLTDNRIILDDTGQSGSILDGGNAESVIVNKFTEANPLNTSAILNGFTITKGAARFNINDFFHDGHGGGIYNEFASVTLTNLVVIANYALNKGGGIFNLDSSTVMSHLIVTGNTGSYGAGIYIEGSLSGKPILDNSIISNNTADQAGGGVYFHTDVVVMNTSIVGNQAKNFGAGVYCNPKGETFINVTLVNNGMKGSGWTSWHNSIIWHEIETELFFFDNCLIKGNSDTSNGNIDATALTADIVFNDPSNLDYTLALNSPAINAGDNDSYNKQGNLATDTDLANNIRLYDGSPILDKIDLGAYEFQGEPLLSLLHLITWDGRSIYIRVEPSDDIFEVKRLIKAKIGMPIVAQELFFDDTKLVEGNTLEDYGIVQGNTVQLNLTLYPGENNIIYVDTNVNTESTDYYGIGSSWAYAVEELADALKWARKKSEAGEANWTQENPLRIFVAKGTYMPMYDADDGQYTKNDGQNNAFVLVNNVQLYGGFDPENGVETMEDKRILPNLSSDIMAGTVLSGDLNGDDQANIPIAELHTHTSRQENVNHVVISAGNVNAARLDGFTITAGKAHGINESMPVILKVNDVSVSDGNNGGGIQIASSSPTISNSVVWRNSAEGSGGGIDINGSPSLMMDNVITLANSARSGGGLNIQESSPLLRNMLITQNNATEIGGGLQLTAGTSKLVNLTISGNSSASNGGGMAISRSQASILNSIVWGNFASESTSSTFSSIYIVPSSDPTTPTISYSLIENSGGSSNWGELLGVDGGSNIDGDPNFTTTTFGETDSFRFESPSPAINAGSNQGYSDLDTDLENGVDLSGGPRVYDYPSQGVIDMGAYEFQGEAYLHIVKVAALDTTTVDYGTSLEDIIGFPTTATATLSDSTEVSISLDDNIDNWTLIEPQGGAFDGNIAGSYVFEVPLTLPTLGEIPYFTNFNNVSVEMVITVAKGKAELSALWNGVLIDSITGLELEYGEQGQLLPQSNASDATFSIHLKSSAIPILNLSDLNAVVAQGIGNDTLIIQHQETNNFESAKLEFAVSVGAKAITIVPAPGQGKIYGEDDPILSYTATGFVNNDTVDLLTGTLIPSVGENVGSYPIEIGSLSAGENYQIQLTSAEFSIRPAPLEITPDTGLFKIFGEADPNFSYHASGFVNNDDQELITGSLGRDEGENTGTYLITIGDLSAGENYQIQLNSAEFSIGPAPLEITPDTGLFKVFGEADPNFSYQASGFVNNDDQELITGSLGRGEGENTGIYSINTGNLSAGSNYEIIMQDATFEIIKADQEILWNQELSFGCGESIQISLSATASSGLPVTYTVSDGVVAEVNGGILTQNAAVAVEVTAHQMGDQNYNPATLVSKTTHLNQEGRIQQHWDDVLVFDNSSGSFVSFQWYKNGIPIEGATRQYYSENEVLNGEYYVVAIKENGEYFTTCPLAVSGGDFTRTISVVPNPARSSTAFELVLDVRESELKGAMVSLFDIRGRLVQSTAITAKETTLEAPIEKGIYIVSVVLSNGQRKTANLLVK